MHCGSKLHNFPEPNLPQYEITKQLEGWSEIQQ